MQKIYLLRHGQAGFAEANYDALSQTGYQQAWRLGRFLTNNGIGFTPQQIITGTMARHRQTLSALWQGLNQQPLQHTAAAIGDDVEQSADWNEYDHHNILAALSADFATPQGFKAYLFKQPDPRAAFAETFRQAVENWISAGQDQTYIESWAGFCARVKQGLTAVTGKQQHKLLVITSGGPISLLAQQLLGAQEQQFLNLNWVLANCGISRVLNGRNGLRLSSLNDYTAFEATPELITYK
jgi:broad specificity phosphatase PhoE